MSLLNKINDKNVWEHFFQHKLSGGNLPKNMEDDLRSFIDNQEYMLIYEPIISSFTLGLPTVKELNKKSKSKKRTVFVFGREENYVLKLIAYLLFKYDHLFSDNLYSFRMNRGVKHAIEKLSRSHNINKKCSYKVDIHDYFNSIDTNLIISYLKEALEDDIPLFELIKNILEESDAIRNGEKITIKKGAMAGVPISGFLANLYLKDLDKWFADRNIPYARYSDDIIVFADSAEEIAYYESIIKEFLSSHKLTVNSQKEFRTKPYEKWEFLGFSYNNGTIDVSSVALQKLKGKIKRKSRALLRWRIKKNVPAERAIKAFIKNFNRKLYDNPIHSNITWCKWYFPVINTPETLHIIDEYMIDCIRYIYTGKYTKSNYNLRYDTIKELGFKSLVNAYYKYQNEKKNKKTYESEQ